MAKYAYAPLSIDDNRNRQRGVLASYFSNTNEGGGGGGDSSNQDDLVHERMPLCVGVCVLLAIVFVLTRTGDSEAIYKSHNQMRAGDHNVSVGGGPTTTTTTGENSGFLRKRRTRK